MLEPISSPDKDYKIQIRIATVQFINIAGWGLNFFSLTALVFGLIPFEISNPVWQLKFYGLIIDNAAIFLVGAVLLIVAKLLNPKDPILSAHAQFVQWLSPAIALGLTLIIPLQVYSGIVGIYAQKDIEDKRLNQIRKVITGIENSPDETELRSFIARLPNPPKLPASFDSPYPTVQRLALASLKIRLSTELDQIKALDLERWQAFILESLRNSIQVLIIAMVFSAIPKQDSPPL
jgi:hypothetical protein